MILLYYACMLYMNTIATLCKHAQKILRNIYVM